MNTTFREKLKNKKTYRHQDRFFFPDSPGYRLSGSDQTGSSGSGNQRSKESGKRRNPGFFRCHHGRK